MTAKAKSPQRKKIVPTESEAWPNTEMQMTSAAVSAGMELHFELSAGVGLWFGFGMGILLTAH